MLVFDSEEAALPYFENELWFLRQHGAMVRHLFSIDRHSALLDEPAGFAVRGDELCTRQERKNVHRTGVVADLELFDLVREGFLHEDAVELFLRLGCIVGRMIQRNERPRKPALEVARIRLLLVEFLL